MLSRWRRESDEETVEGEPAQMGQVQWKRQFEYRASLRREDGSSE